jgi:hypothetical protein
MLRRAAWVASLVGLIGLAFTGLNCSRVRGSGPAPPRDEPPAKAVSAPEQVPPVQEVLPAPKAPVVRQTIIGMVRAAAPDAPEAATVDVDGVVYKVVNDDNGKTVAREARDRRAEIKGTVEEKDSAKWITVLSAKLGPY